ncbi:MAG: response regulator transcription factor [Peptococcaceae bacterium]|jgi:two-component system alkaline phosphatase synthesis response regulator PhoP|nr:response regulator transcription factor [Peptococcaceae bacterium]
MIYVVEDESNIRKLVVYTLQYSGFETEGFGDATAFWQAMRQRTPKLVLLDIMLPGEDGLSILQKIRAVPSTAKLPIMLLTAKDSEYDKVFGLDLGADDYLAKPFGMMEMVARVKSLLRRTDTNAKEPETFAIGGLFVSIPRHLVSVQGEEVVLTLKEFDVLVLLLRHQGIVFSRDKIMSEIWGYDFDGESRTIDVHIRTLRQKLGVCEHLIETIRGVGYRIGGSG